MIFKLRCARVGGHVDTRLFVGPDEDHLALSGRLSLRFDEYQLFLAVMELGTVESHNQFIHVFDNEVSQ